MNKSKFYQVLRALYGEYQVRKRIYFVTAFAYIIAIFANDIYDNLFTLSVAISTTFVLIAMLISIGIYDQMCISIWHSKKQK